MTLVQLKFGTCRLVVMFAVYVYCDAESGISFNVYLCAGHCVKNNISEVYVSKEISLICKLMLCQRHCESELEMVQLI